MAITTFTGDLSAFFPAGTSLEARPASNWAAHKRPPEAGTTPPGSAAATATSAASGVLSLTGLADSTEYYVSDAAGTRYVRITTYPERQEVMTNQAGQANGYPQLDANAKVPWALLAGSVANVLDAAYGGVADAVSTTGTVTASGSTVTLTSGSFTSADIGKVVLVGGAGATVNLGASNGGVAVPRPVKGWIASVAGGVASLVTASGGSTPVSFTTSQTDTAVTYGTNLYAALVAAIATGRTVEVPAGDYILVGTITGQVKRLIGAGHPARIYVSPDFTSFTPSIAAGIGLTGTARTLGANATAGDLTLTLSSALSTIAAGDILFLNSTATWEPSGTDSDATATKKGEFVRVQQVSGTTVYLESPIADSYTTATTASVQKFAHSDGFDVSGLYFVNATPSVVTYSAATPMALSQYGGGGKLFWVERYKNVRFTDVEFQGLGGSHIFMNNCIDFDVSRTKTRDSAELGDYGYTVSLFASQWGQVSNCRARKSSSLFNAQGVLADASGQANMPTRWVEVRDCTAHEGQHEPFLTHVTAEFVDFIDCKVYGGAFYATETGHSSGFRIFGRNCKLINPLTQRTAGTAIVLAGKNCEIHNPVIRNVVPNYSTSRGIELFGVNPGATGTVIRGADIDTVKQTAAHTEGHGILVGDGATARIIGRNELRNVEGYGVYDRDSTNATVVDGLEGVNHGAAASSFTPYLIQRDSGSSVVSYRNIRGTFTHATARITNTEAALDVRYTKITADGTFSIPDGVKKVRARLVGAGGGGGGAGSAAAAQLQAGGGGGAGGSITEVVFDVSTNETLTIDVGTGGAGGGGGAAGGNAGSNGSQGGTTSISNAGPTVRGTALGGSGGRSSSASSTTGGNAGLWGSQGGSSSGTSTAGSGGVGGFATGPPMLNVVGGGGGGAATATLGGGKGTSQGAANYPIAQAAGSNGASGTSAGVTADAAVLPGCGGGGGGGGAAGTGAGGAGGAGADGLVELWW